MSVIEDIKLKTDIVEVIGQYTKLSKAGRNMRALCPFHSEKQPSFYVYPEQQSWHCFGACSTGGDVFAFIMKKEGLSFGEALRFLAERAGVPLPTYAEPGPARDEKDKLYQVNQAAAQYFQHLLINTSAAQKVREYVARRGLTEKTIADFQLGYSPDSWEALLKYLKEKDYTESDLLAAGLIIKAESGQMHDRFRNRLMFPIQDIKGRVIGFGARELDGSMPKYLNSPQTAVFDKGGTLYGLHQATAAIRKLDVVVIVEGYVDVITAHQYGFTNVIASMGTAISDKHLVEIKRLTHNVTLALDSDSAGEEAMLRCVGYENTLGAEIKVVLLPEGKDPDDVIKEENSQWQTLLEKALPVIDFTFDRVTSGIDLATARGKTALVDRLLAVISGIDNPVRRDHYLNKLARLTQTDYRKLEYTLNGLKLARRNITVKPPASARGRRSAVSSPREEYCLALLLKHPELKTQSGIVLPEYFLNSENREIFTAWQRVADTGQLKVELEPAIGEYLDYLTAREIPALQIEQKLMDCANLLREDYLRNMETKRKEVLAAERESGGTDAELAMQKEQGLIIKEQLLEVFKQRGRANLPLAEGSKETRNAG